MKYDQGMQPLTGVTVVEWSEDTATALCGQLLTGLGARVIVVEPPGAKRPGGSPLPW